MTVDLAEGEIEYHFEKSHLFRVVHVDGAVGAISPGDSFIHMSVFSERAPIPKRMVHALQPDGIVGPENREKRDVRPGAFREMEVDLVFNLETAVRLRAWLDHTIQELQHRLLASRSRE